MLRLQEAQNVVGQTDCLHTILQLGTFDSCPCDFLKNSLLWHLFCWRISVNSLIMLLRLLLRFSLDWAYPWNVWAGLFFSFFWEGLFATGLRSAFSSLHALLILFFLILWGSDWVVIDCAVFKLGCNQLQGNWVRMAWQPTRLRGFWYWHKLHALHPNWEATLL